MRNSVLALAGVALLSGCPGRHDPIDLLYVCDPSTSSHCSAENIRQALDPFIRKPKAGSHAQVITVGCGSDDAESVLEINVRERWGSGVNQAKRLWSEIELEHLRALRLRQPRPCSGIVGAVARAARVSEQSGRSRRRMLIDSDLREASDETGYNFERAIPSPSEFVETVRQRGLLPKLEGVELVVCDVHSDSSPNARRWSARQSAALRAVWTAYFAAAGAGAVEFLERCPWQDSNAGEYAWAGSR